MSFWIVDGVAEEVEQTAVLVFVSLTDRSNLLHWGGGQHVPQLPEEEAIWSAPTRQF